MHIQVNESLNSYFIRNILVNYGYIETSEYNSAMIGTEFMWRRTFVPELNSSQIKQSKGLEPIIIRHSLIGLYRALIPLDIYIKLVSKVMKTDVPNFTLPNFFYGYGKHTSCEFYYCRTCLKERLSIKGFIWFDVQWQFHDIEYCSTHNTRLNSSHCNVCQYGSGFYRPNYKLQKAFVGVCSQCEASFLESENFRDVKYDRTFRYYLRISDKAIFREKFPCFTRKLIVKIIEEAAYRYSKKELLKKHHSPLARMLPYINDNKNVKDYLSGRQQFIQHRVFWQIIRFGFGCIDLFKCYLYKHSKIRIINSRTILPYLTNSFLVKQLDYVGN